MKTTLTLIVYAVQLINPLCANTKKSGEMVHCGTISMEIAWEFLEQGKALPFDWDELANVRMIREGRLERNLFTMKTLNRFALVPLFPEIQNDTEIPKSYVGKQLYMISREPEYDPVVEAPGRYAILIGPADLASEDQRVQSLYIPEKAAEAILSQIPDFDPKNQPLAFEDSLIRSVEKEQRGIKDSLRKQFYPDWERQKKINRADQKWLSTDEAASGNLLGLIGSMLISVLAVIFFLLLRKTCKD